MTNLFVGNLPYGVNDDALRQIFTAIGNVISAKVITDRYSGNSRGFGFVQMSTDAEAQKAIEMFHLKDVDGRKLVVNESRPNIGKV